MLGSSDEALCRAYDLAMLDLDGVVYVGGAAVPGAPAHLASAREQGMRLAFITNNASRPPGVVAAHLTELGVEAEAADVVTSAQAAARVLVDRYGAGARVVCLGAEGLQDALEEDGLVPVGVEDDAAAIVTGYGPQVPWGDIMRAAVRVRDGLPWVASNTDLTFPAAFGVAPGHGVLVEMLRSFTGVDPVVAGKPERPLLDETVRRVGGRRPLMVGDRLDTDIEGAQRAGYDSLLVLTGVTGLEDLVAATKELRPTFVAPDLAGLLAAQRAPSEDDGAFELGGWRATVGGGRLDVGGSGEPDDWWRVAASAAWAHLDATGETVDLSGVEVPGR
ncbi:MULTISPECIES: HAD-IIA family hydrolase [unclassified Nocardioides]|uniref:HAD-IIA family hydrolase n=1 Tax=unclassified Nocardioides TaxID=2615069 RepID=UPI0009EFBA23|nr:MULTISPECIES: HAD-IIA family hydrolase [unclassified Nocardioides]GAW49327.1 HAD family hydrolase [Nocardioides sp. PD653-B2]GAW55815.1 HAD family hydrolase [Nocardioides sp. PD653]